MGLCDYPPSRAVYAVDLMLKWDGRPDGKEVLHAGASAQATQSPRAPPGSTFEGPGCARVSFFVCLLACFFTYLRAVRVCVRACTHAWYPQKYVSVCVCCYPLKSEEGTGAPGTGVKNGCKAPCGF